jgi:hypothetical protein
LGKKENENIYDKIQELFGNLQGNYSILEEQIDIDLQMEYFDFSKKLKKDFKPEDILEKKEMLFDETTDKVKKKLLLVQLASLEEVDAYRTIERYVKEKHPTLHEWAILALQESRMLLESKLLDENQVFISTGLGGKENKLRYFLVVIKKDQEDFTDVQKKVVKSEFEFTLNNHDAEIEDISFFKNFGTITSVIPLDSSIKEIFKQAISECNNFGNFLKSNFIVTNVKRLSIKEIQDFIKKNDLGSKNEP